MNNLIAAVLDFHCLFSRPLGRVEFSDSPRLELAYLAYKAGDFAPACLNRYGEALVRSPGLK